MEENQYKKVMAQIQFYFWKSLKKALKEALGWGWTPPHPCSALFLETPALGITAHTSDQISLSKTKHCSGCLSQGPSYTEKIFRLN